MSADDLDSPALVLPRVLDIHGTFLRLGFTGYAANRQCLEHYRMDVPLFNGGIVVTGSARRCSHVHFRIIMNSHDATEGRIHAKYGYPERYPKRKKIILSFKALLRDETHESLDFSSDQRLMAFENRMRLLVFNLKNFPLDLNETVDSEDGLVERQKAEADALEGAVASAFYRNDKVDVNTWFEINMEPEPKASYEWAAPRTPNRQSRLPNFDRRRHVLRHVRRPV